MNAIDTNVWLYSHDNRDQRKQGVAQQLIAASSPWRRRGRSVASSSRPAENSRWRAVKKRDDLFTAEALMYSATDTGYLLYSVGVNGKDDGGQSYGDDPPGDDLVVRMQLPALRQ